MVFLKKLWVATYVAGITAILLASIIWITSQFFKPHRIDDTWVKSYCQISKIMAKNGPHVYVSYWVKDTATNATIIKEEYAASLRLATPVIGEIFPMIYNPKSPDEFFAFSWKPLFLKKEITELAIGEISRAPFQSTFFPKKPEKYSTHRVEFTYKANRRTYRKTQDLPPMFVQTNPGKIKKGDRFEVQYWVENPQRAIIHLDKPVH